MLGGRGAAERPLPVGKYGELVPSNIPDFSRLVVLVSENMKTRLHESALSLTTARCIALPYNTNTIDL